MPHKMSLYLHRIHLLDSALCIRVNRTSQNRLVRLWFRLISRLGDGIFWYAVMVGILLSQGEAVYCHACAWRWLAFVARSFTSGSKVKPHDHVLTRCIKISG